MNETLQNKLVQSLMRAPFVEDAIMRYVADVRVIEKIENLW